MWQFHRTTTPLPSPQRDPLSKGQVFPRRRCEHFNAFNVFLSSHNFFPVHLYASSQGSRSGCYSVSLFFPCPLSAFWRDFLSSSTYTYWTWMFWTLISLTLNRNHTVVTVSSWTFYFITLHPLVNLLQYTMLKYISSFDAEDQCTDNSSNIKGSCLIF